MGVRVTMQIPELSKEVEKEFRRNARKVVGEGAKVLHKEIRRRLSRAGSRAAEPGEAPTKRSGKLMRSVKRTSTRVSRYGASAGVRISHPGAARLEFGAVDSRGIRTLPYPYVRPSIEAKRAEIEKIIADGIVSP